MQTKLSEYVKVAEAAEILGVSQGTIRAWAESEKSQCTRIRPMDTDCFVATNSVRFWTRWQKRADRGNEHTRKHRSWGDRSRILPEGIVTVSDVRWIGTVAIEVTYKDTAGRLGNELLYRDREPTLEVVESGLHGVLMVMHLFQVVVGSEPNPPGIFVRPFACSAHIFSTAASSPNNCCLQRDAHAAATTIPLGG